MPQTFDESTVIRRVAREGLLIAGGGRATVLQNAHPLIAKGTTVGLLPAPIREGLGYSWTPRQDRLLRHGLRLTARLYPHLPDVLRQAPKTSYLRSLGKRITPTKP